MWKSSPSSPSSGPVSGSTSIGAVAKAKAKSSQPSRPRDYFPDTVVWFSRGGTVDLTRTGGTSSNESPFVETLRYSTYQAFETFASNPRFVLFCDWHQVLDRLATEESWNNTFPRDSIRFLQDIKQKAEEIFGDRNRLQICILSHKEHSSRNVDNLLDTCNTLNDLRSSDLITTIFVTRERTGPTGKAAVIRSFTRHFAFRVQL